MLYTVAIIFFVITGISFAALSTEFERTLSVVSTTIFGLLFLALGFAFRPKPTAAPASTTLTSVAPQPPISAPPPPSEPIATITREPAPIAETVVPAKAETVTETVLEAVPRKLRLTRLKGVGKTRAKQLNDLGVRNIEDLSNASAEDLAKKLNISPKITGRWIAGAKELLGKS
jgi:predicted flap endonuclease-1-like 5' DNA nuclease